MDTVWIDSHWYFDYSRDAWVLTGEGVHLIAEVPEIVLQIQARDIRPLIEELDKEGWIRPRLDERLRVEDLKITHRLLDIIEKKIKEGNDKGKDT